MFEVASEIVDFHVALRGVQGLEFLGEDGGYVLSDEDFFIKDENDQPKANKQVPRRFYFTIPDRTALRSLLGLWRRYQRGEELDRGQKAWKNVFGHLADIRPWGPKDRLTEDAMRDWSERLKLYPDEPVRLEVEFWYRDDALRRRTTEEAFIGKIGRV